MKTVIQYSLLFCLAGMKMAAGMAQPVNDPVKENAIDRITEAISESTDQEIDFTAMVEPLQMHYEEPLDINTATRDQLESLLLLSDLQIDKLLEYIERHGALLTLYELQVVPGWDEETIYLLQPFITVKRSESSRRWKWKDALQRSKHELVFRYDQVTEEQRGYLQPVDSGASHYLGSPYRLFFRYRFSYRDKWSAGFVLKKDRGEEFFTGSQPLGFDYVSAHCFFRSLGPFEQVALGDFQAQFGQGLVIWKGFGSRKSVFVNNLRRQAPGLRPYSATNAFLFFRGGGLAVKFGPVRLTALASYKLLDGSRSASDSLTPGWITAMDESGYHRTENELAKRNALTELVTAGRMQYIARKWNIGFTGVYTRYSVPVIPDTVPYLRYAFRGDQVYNLGLDYTLLLGKIYLFGEVAVSGNGGYALLQGVQAYLPHGVSLSMLYRDYARNYQAPHAQAFGDRSGVQNERGWYMGIECSPLRRFRLNAYADVVQVPWLTYTTSRPSWGYDAVAQLTYVPGRHTELVLRYRHTLRQQDGTSEGVHLPEWIDVHRDALRLNLTHQLNERFKLRSRVEVVFMDRPDRPLQWGFMAYQDMMYTLPWWPVDISARIAVFRTDGYDTRIYAYENDLLYSFSVPAYYDKGMRFYVNLQSDIVKGLSVSFRVAQFYFAGVQTVGSGLDEIQGNTRTEIKAQLRYRFGLPRFREKTHEQPALPMLPEGE